MLTGCEKYLHIGHLGLNLGQDDLLKLGSVDLCSWFELWSLLYQANSLFAERTHFQDLYEIPALKNNCSSQANTKLKFRDEATGPKSE